MTELIFMIFVLHIDIRMATAINKAYHLETLNIKFRTLKFPQNASFNIFSNSSQKKMLLYLSIVSLFASHNLLLIKLSDLKIVLLRFQ